MSGNDEATAWLLAIVACWRKIARWAFPAGAAGEEKTLTPEQQEPYRYDLTVSELTNPQPVGVGSTAGDSSVPWLTQW
jgi:hypothetical protein